MDYAYNYEFALAFDAHEANEKWPTLPISGDDIARLKAGQRA